MQTVDLIHPGMANVPKELIKRKLSTQMKVKEENISIFGLHNKFGGGRSTGFALIYDNLDAVKQHDTKVLLRRVSISDNLVAFAPSVFPRQ